MFCEPNLAVRILIEQKEGHFCSHKDSSPVEIGHSIAYICDIFQNFSCFA
jgi:hypothetical protein